MMDVCCFFLGVVRAGELLWFQRFWGLGALSDLGFADYRLFNLRLSETPYVLNPKP